MPKARKRKSVEGLDAKETYRDISIKVKLGRLRPSPDLRAAIEDATSRVQDSVARGLLLANHTLIRELACGRFPDITSQTWWLHCIKIWGRSDAGVCSRIHAATSSHLRRMEEEILPETAFWCYGKRDKCLDALCKEITSGVRGTLVAFGGAASCSTGFGYAPVPQKRLRAQLEKVHGARVCAAISCIRFRQDVTKR